MNHSKGTAEITSGGELNHTTAECVARLVRELAKARRA